MAEGALTLSGGAKRGRRKTKYGGREEMGTMASVHIFMYMYASSSSVASKLCSLPFDRTSWPYRYVSVSAKIVATPRPRYPRETSVFSVSKLKLNLPFEQPKKQIKKEWWEETKKRPKDYLPIFLMQVIYYIIFHRLYLLCAASLITCTRVSAYYAICFCGFDY